MFEDVIYWVYALLKWQNSNILELSLLRMNRLSTRKMDSTAAFVGLDAKVVEASTHAAKAAPSLVGDMVIAPLHTSLVQREQIKTSGLICKLTMSQYFCPYLKSMVSLHRARSLGIG